MFTQGGATVAESDETQIATRTRAIDLVSGDRVHCLELSVGGEVESRHVISPLGLKIGRTEPADLVIADTAISRAHCMVMLKGDEVLVSDLNSTNGTFVDGEKVAGLVPLPVGSVLQVGSRMLRHEWRTRAEIESSNEFDRDLQQAASYVRALLPPVSQEGPVKADWAYYPSAKLGGDAFGYGHLRDDLYSCYLIDVAGHGAGSAMHAVAIMNQLRQKSLPNTDMAQPQQVLGALNELFQMEDHAGLYFTIWYGVYDQKTRQLDYASGGHHPAYILPAGGGDEIPLRTRNIMIGAMPSMNFTQASVEVPAGARMYVFSDGVFEIVDKQGRQWAIDQFIELMKQPPVEDLGEPQRLYREMRSQVPGGTFDDDFSLVVFDFD